MVIFSVEKVEAGGWMKTPIGEANGLDDGKEEFLLWR
jgi:hypothetical protein